MTWITEDPWPLLWFCLVAGGVSLAGGLTGRGDRFLYAGLALLGLCPVVWLVERQIVTEAEEVENRVQELAAAFIANNEESFLDCFEPGNVKLRALALSAIKMADVPDLALRDLEVSDAGSASQGRSYQSHFRANGTVHSLGMQTHAATRWRLVWQLRDNRWRVVAVTRLHPVREEELDVFSSEH